MEYCGFSIQVQRYRAYLQIQTFEEETDEWYSFQLSNTLSGRRDNKPTSTTIATLEVSLCGYRIIDLAFIFELRVILADFAAKRLGPQRQGYGINRVQKPFGSECDGVCILREDSQLFIKRIDDERSVLLASFDIISAKTLLDILNKAIHASDFQ